MDKNTVLAVVLSVLVITIGFSVQNILYPPEQVEETEQTADSQTGDSQTADGAPVTETTAEETLPEPAAVRGRIFPAEHAADGPDSIPDGSIQYRNELFEVTFSPLGGDITSYRLLDHLDGEQPVEMIYRTSPDQSAFTLHFGGANATPVSDKFYLRSDTAPNIVEFYRNFYVSGGQNDQDIPFRVRKVYRFKPGEYLFEMDVIVENLSGGAVPLNFDGVAYTLGIGPQIGPSYVELDGRNEYRRFNSYDGNKRRNIDPKPGRPEVLTNRPAWTAMAGKYFTIIGIPGGNVEYRITLSKDDNPALEDSLEMYFSRPVIRSQSQTDTYRFFVGPRTDDALARYNRPQDNAFGIRNMDLEKMVDSRFLVGWLENILKVGLNLIYRVIPNYGVAIIILTVLVKILLSPLMHKSYESTAKMQALSPKMQEIREKYKDNPQKVNSEIAALYKKEGVNPAGGCMPLLVQFPFFIAMFGLFNNHFDLRGAVFIPGWITDLSSPESIFHFGGFRLPLLGWTDLRLLPVLFVVSQILSSKAMQPAGAADNSQMKMMTTMLPVVFFFVLYNMPSGLLVYWIFSNILTAGQQIYINRKRAAAKAA
jgi:YidC/Oxa1 family membrane protein insertase